MRPNTFKRKLAAGETTVGAWLSIPSGYAAEIVASQGVDAAVVDLQHGMIGLDTALAMLQAVSATNATPLARSGGIDDAQIMRLLDSGAYGVVCPMISTPQDAAEFVAACRYPPVGRRSYGPARGLLYGGPDYVSRANGEIMAVAMIETRAGVDNVQQIAAVEGVDALFIGPNDLALDLGSEPVPESRDPVVVDAIRRIREAGAEAGIPVGIFASTPEAAAARAREGFLWVVPDNDAGLLAKATARGVAAVREA